MRTRSLSLSVFVGLLAATVWTTGGQAQSPTALPLVQAANLRYLGFFRLPASDGSGSSPGGDLTYGGTALSLSPSGGLFIAGHDQAQHLCEVTIPAIGGTATIRQRCVDVTEGRMAQIDQDAIKLGGTLVHNGRLIISAFSYYDADGSQTRSHFASGTTLSTSGDLTGPVQVGTAGAGFVSGQMAIVPAEWRSLLGGPALTGNCCLSIISRTSSGPSVSVFDPDDIGRLSPVPATELVGYPLDHPLASGNSANAYYTNADMMGGIAFPAGTRSVLFIGRHGTGTPCYGEASPCGDRASIYKGYHAYPYQHQVWAYDANDLLAVKNGTRRPWEIRPYAMWALTEMDNSGGASIAGATFDPATRRLYVTEAYGTTPRVHVYEVTAGTPSQQDGVEQCGDGIDNDGDGQIDEGCTAAAPPAPVAPPVTPIAPNAPTPEICGDNVDNNGNGLVDETCPGVPQRLTGTVNGTTVTLSWLAPIAGAPPTQYIVDAGLASGQTAYSFAAGPGTGVRVANVGRGRYYVRVRAANAAGGSAPSNEAVVSVGCSTAPRPLTNLLTRVRGALVTMTWTDPDGCADTSYRVSVAAAPGGASIAQVAASQKSITALAGPGVYYLRAAAVNNRGISAPTAEIRADVTTGTCVPPSFATALGAQVNGSLVQLAWNPARVADALAADAVVPFQYVLEAGIAPGGTNVRLPLGRTTAFATRVPRGTYYVRVRPSDVCGLGTASNDVVVHVQ